MIENVFRVCKEAVEHFGIDSQERKLFEEMAELQNAICKKHFGRASNDDVCTEIADVMIMCFQMAYIYGGEEVLNQLKYKINRLKRRMQ